MAQNQEKTSEKADIAKREENVLSFWRTNKVFEKTEEKDAPEGEFVFYDGPPFATGLPHYGHILAGTIKDAFPRYKTMRGFRVRRRWGWDCHGLPLENEIEKELGLETKRDIIEYGIGKFNAKAREAVLRYADDWRKIVPRMGRFVHMDRDYKTMDASYTESVWWAFSELYKKKLLYEGFKSMHLCPRCETTLSNFEVNQGYKDIQDFAVTVKLELKDEPGTYLLVWTTTPWTLPGNMAAAVNRDATYIKVRLGDERLIVAKDRAALFEESYEIESEFSGAELVGKAYTPPFGYFLGKDIEGKENAWKVYHAPYVSLEEGTGAVHLAPAFGEEDMDLAKQEGIPLVHHVTKDGKFTDDVTDFAGVAVKPKDTKDEPTKHQSADIEIIKHLAHKGLLFKKEKITHSYPLCWRCDTPLLNYASSSWFVEVTKFNNKLVDENKKIGWVPEEIGKYRFGNWLEGARDWAISRARFWGAPLPVWKHPKTGAPVVIGSIGEMKKHAKTSGNQYFLMRHGEAESNLNNIVSSGVDDVNPLTVKGREQVRAAFEEIKRHQFDAIYVSPLQRTRETAELVKEHLGFSDEQVIVDDRLREVSFGVLNGKSRDEYWKFYTNAEERFEKAPEGGETVLDVKRRAGEFLYEVEQKKRGKKILVIAHEDVVWMLTAVSCGLDKDGCFGLKGSADDFFKNAEVRALGFTPLPHNEDYELDLHRPYIDEYDLEGEDGQRLERVEDVFDCWFESGSMPYAQHHYPFEHLDVFDPEGGLFKKRKGYPADFIAEGLDQTRGWFYSLIVLGTALFGRSPYKNVVVNGTILAEDGQKMSKRLKNYPDPMEVVDRYGADAVRLYLLSSPVVRGEDFNFSEDGVAEVMRKVIGRTANVLSFYELYRQEKNELSDPAKSTNVLDQWLLARLAETSKEMTEAMERYELDRATRPLFSLADDLSTWYLRRSRDRFKGRGDDADKLAALATTRSALLVFARLSAPFTPFFAEHLWQELRGDEEEESVHLSAWPTGSVPDKDILERMDAVRAAVTDGLEARTNAGIKVRQPLASLSIADERLAGRDDLLALIRDEVNVKDIRVDSSLKHVELDTEITDELRREGAVRDVLRFVQDLRKKAGRSPQDVVVLTVATDAAGKELLQEFEQEIKETASLSEIVFVASLEGEVFATGDFAFTFSLSPNP